MQLSIWIIAISVVFGSVLMGLLLHRIGFSRAVTLGLGAAILGGMILISREPLVDSSDPRETPVSTAAPPSAVATTVDAAAPETTHQTAPAAESAALAREKAAHEETRRALDAARNRIAAREIEARATASAPTGATTEPQATREKLRDTELRLAIAEAEIERLKAAIRAAEPVATTAPLPQTPQPFAYAPAPEQTLRTTEPQTGRSAEIATGATTQPSGHDSRSAVIGRIFADAMRSRRFTLVKLANDELIDGRRGSYYRITCPGDGNRPLSFASGDYTFAAGGGLLETCIKAVQSALLETLPPDTKPGLYVQGYASQRGFIRPKRFPARDTHLRSISYLPRVTSRDRFSTTKARQTTGRQFTNAELPNLRAANVAHLIDKATKGAVQPEILEGEPKAGNDAASQSFALVLHVTW